MYKIYTKAGDNGMTALYGGARVSKGDERVEAYGSVDELSSWLGLVLCEKLEKPDLMWITAVQKNLYICMSALSGSPVDLNTVATHTVQTEKLIDSIAKKLPELRNFILPQGTYTSALLHVVRTICRRAERAAVRSKGDNAIVQYLNRLSDALFMLARKYNTAENEVVLA